jgi:hypothetical protein
MARLADQFTAIDANDLLRPISNPSEIAVKWDDGTKSTFQISVTFTQTAFDGRRAFFICPRCQRRCRKLYVNGFYRILACRRCLASATDPRSGYRNACGPFSMRWERTPIDSDSVVRTAGVQNQMPYDRGTPRALETRFESMPRGSVKLRSCVAAVDAITQRVQANGRATVVTACGWPDTERVSGND